MIRHHFHLNDGIAIIILLFDDLCFDPAIDWRQEYLPPIFWIKDNRVPATIRHGSISVQFVSCHGNILSSNIRSTNSAKGNTISGQPLAPYIPLLKQVGFTGRFTNELKP